MRSRPFRFASAPAPGALAECGVPRRRRLTGWDGSSWRVACLGMRKNSCRCDILLLVRLISLSIGLLSAQAKYLLLLLDIDPFRCSPRFSANGLSM